MRARAGLHARLVVCAVVASACLFPRPVLCGDSLDVAEWLGWPGVKLVAVEFYATWCKPCMEAMPRWAALKDKYRAQGLRVVVVNTLDPQGGCQHRLEPGRDRVRPRRPRRRRFSAQRPTAGGVLVVVAGQPAGAEGPHRLGVCRRNRQTPRAAADAGAQAAETG